jgi:hypothetical protein
LIYFLSSSDIKSHVPVIIAQLTHIGYDSR